MAETMFMWSGFYQSGRFFILAFVAGKYGKFESLKGCLWDLRVWQQGGRAEQPRQVQLGRGRRGRGQWEGVGVFSGPWFGGHAVGPFSFSFHTAGLFVLGQVGFQGKTFATFWAGERLVGRMCLNVRSQVTFVCKGFVTQIALKWFLAGVGSDVSRQVGRAWESLGTELALILLIIWVLL